MTPPSVYVAVPTHRHFHPLVCDSLLRAQRAALKEGIDITVDVTTAMMGTGVQIDRSHCIDAYYKSGKDILAFIDSDICFTPQDFIHMTRLAAKYGCVAGVYPSRTDADGGIFISNNFKKGQEGEAYCNVEVSEDGTVTWPGLVAGLGFCFTRRDIIGDMLDATEKTTTITEEKGRRLDDGLVVKLVVDWGYTEGHGVRGEDHMFFDLVRKTGHTPWIWPNVTLGHITDQPIVSRLSDLMQLK